MIDKFAGLPTQIRQLEKRLKEMDASKVKPALVKEITDTIKNLKEMLKEKQEKREQRKKEKEQAAQEVQKEAITVPSATEIGAVAPNAVNPVQEGQPEATPTTPNNQNASCPLCGGLKFADQAQYQSHMEFTHGSNVMPTSPTQKLDKTVAAVDPVIDKVETDPKIAPGIIVPDSVKKHDEVVDRVEKDPKIAPHIISEQGPQFKLDDVVMPIRGSESKGKVMRWDGKPNDLVYVMWESGPLKDRDGFGGYYPHDLKADVAPEPVEAALPESKPVCEKCVAMQEKHGDLKTNYEALLKDLQEEREAHYAQGNHSWVMRLDQKIEDLKKAIAEKFGTEKVAGDGLDEHQEHTQISNSIENVEDLQDIIENRLGWAVAGQFRDIMMGEALEEQNSNALRYIAEFLEKRKDRNPGAAEVAVEIRNYLSKEENLLKGAEYQPKTGEPCSCKPGQARDNCPMCEGTGMKVDYKKIREAAVSEPCPKCKHGIDDHNAEGYCDPCVGHCGQKKTSSGGPRLIRQINKAVSGHGYEATEYDLANGQFKQNIPLKINETNVRMTDPTKSQFEIKYDGMDWRLVAPQEFEQWLAQWKEINQTNTKQAGWSEDMTAAYQRGLSDAQAGKPSNEDKEEMKAAYRQGYGHGLRSTREAGAQNAEELTIMDHTPPRANSGPDAGGKDPADEFQDEWAMPVTSATKLNVFKRELLATPTNEGYDISLDGKKLFNITGKDKKPMNKKQLEFCAQIEFTRGMKQAKLVEKIANLDVGSTVFVMAQDKTTKRVKFASLEHGFRGWAPASKFAFLVKEGQMMQHKDHIDNTFGHNGKQALVDCPNGSGNMVWVAMGELLPINPPPATPESLNDIESTQKCKECGTGHMPLTRGVCTPCRKEKKASLNFPLTYFTRPEAKERADQFGLIDVEDADLTPAGLAAKKQEMLEGHDIEGATKVVDDKVEMPKDEFIKEHEKLVKELEPIVEEHKEQGAELKEVKEADVKNPINWNGKNYFGILADLDGNIINGYTYEQGEEAGWDLYFTSEEDVAWNYGELVYIYGENLDTQWGAVYGHGGLQGTPEAEREAKEPEILAKVKSQIKLNSNNVKASKQCPLCGRDFADSKSYTDHTKRHKVTGAKECPDCKGHFEGAEGEKCPTCGRFAVQKESLKQALPPQILNRRTEVNADIDDEENETEIEPGDLVDFGAYGKLYVVYLAGRSSRVTDIEEERFNPEARGWYFNVTGNEPIVEKGSSVKREDVDIEAAADQSSLVKEFYAKHPTYNGWLFDYEYPGYFAFYSNDGSLSVYFTPDFNEEGVVDIQIMNNEGEYLGGEDVPYKAPLNADQLFEIVKPFLDKQETLKTSSLNKIARVVHQDDGWHVLSEKGKNLGGPYKTKAEAVKRLRQVEYFKHHGSLRAFAKTDKIIKRAETLIDPYQALTTHITDMRNRMTQVQEKIQSVPAVKTAGEDNSKLDLPGLFADLTQGIELLETKLGKDTKPELHKQVEELENKLWKLEEACGLTPKLSEEEKAEPEHKEIVEDIEKEAGTKKRKTRNGEIEQCWSCGENFELDNDYEGDKCRNCRGSLKKADTPVDPNAPATPVPQVQNVQPTDADNLEVPVVAPTSPPPPGQKWTFDTEFNKYVLMPDPAATNKQI